MDIPASRDGEGHASFPSKAEISFGVDISAEISFGVDISAEISGFSAEIFSAEKFSAVIEAGNLRGNIHAFASGGEGAVAGRAGMG